MVREIPQNSRRAFLKKSALIGTAGSVAVAGCTGTGGDGNIIKIGAMGPLSGPYAVYGENGRKGAELALSHLNLDQSQFEYELVIADTGGSPSTGVQRARELVEQDGVSVLIGFASSAVALAVSEWAKNQSVIVLATIAQTPSIVSEPNCHPQAFRTSATDITINRGLAQVVSSLIGSKDSVKITAILPDYIFGEETWNAFKSEMENQIPEVIFGPAIYTELGKGEYQNEIRTILSSQPDILYSSFLGGDLDALIQQGRQVDMFDLIPEFVNGGGAIMNTALSFGNEMVEMIAAERYYFQNPNSEMNQRFVRDYIDTYDEIPVNVAQENYAGVMAIHNALLRNEGDSSIEGIVGGLKGLEFEAPEGTKLIRAQDHQVIEENIWAGRLLPIDNYDFFGFPDIVSIPGAKVTPAPNCSL